MDEFCTRNPAPDASPPSIPSPGGTFTISAGDPTGGRGELAPPSWFAYPNPYPQRWPKSSPPFVPRAPQAAQPPRAARLPLVMTVLALLTALAGAAAVWDLLDQPVPRAVVARCVEV